MRRSARRVGSGSVCGEPTPGGGGGGRVAASAVERRRATSSGRRAAPARAPSRAASSAVHSQRGALQRLGLEGAVERGSPRGARGRARSTPRPARAPAARRRAPRRRVDELERQQPLPGGGRELGVGAGRRRRQARRHDQRLGAGRADAARTLARRPVVVARGDRQHERDGVRPHGGEHRDRARPRLAQQAVAPRVQGGGRRSLAHASTLTDRADSGRMIVAVEVEQIAEGLWRWVVDDGAGGQVASTYLEAPDAIVLVDPVLPPEGDGARAVLARARPRRHALRRAAARDRDGPARARRQRRSACATPARGCWPRGRLLARRRPARRGLRLAGERRGRHAVAALDPAPTPRSSPAPCWWEPTAACASQTRLSRVLDDAPAPRLAPGRARPRDARRARPDGRGRGSRPCNR